ncbi:Spermidine synthase [Vibrio ruber DSM 16370]|uniref:Polyamine aminopropyltransferase n=1 Tax=Vibrio ruber (strain DSM 16370 / JCM 11486 / BCRC 17186 / CECT 7878 / LMG 23124 / VR1) TaxID=1123498 RepID=A0A1R4LF82_VIBR1|nr:fused MFS/spermidine synthase [Vibrio ruber]SJN55228.1 Spermidine synthase [Vibrio ruber DSM 16370]
MLKKMLSVRIWMPVVMLLIGFSAQSEVIYTQKSLYRDIAVVEKDGLRCLVFALVKGDSVQTCQYQDEHDQRLVYSYSQMVMGGLLLNPHPQRILVIGLGGASIPNVLTQLYPDAEMDIVELDPGVVKVARDYFHFQETPQTSVAVADGRVFVKRALLRKKKYDFIILDAFTGDYIPEHLMTREYLQEVQRLMTEDGVLVANTWSSSRLYAHESETYRQVFGPFFNFKIKQEQNYGNRIIIVGNGKQALPSRQVMQQRAKSLVKSLAPYNVLIDRYPALMSTKADWDRTARPLTDQYSPANLL